MWEWAFLGALETAPQTPRSVPWSHVPSTPRPPAALPLVLRGAWRGALVWTLFALVEAVLGLGAEGRRAEGGAEVLFLLAETYGLAGLGLGGLCGALVAWLARGAADDDLIPDSRGPRGPLRPRGPGWLGRLDAALALGPTAALAAHWLGLWLEKESVRGIGAGRLFLLTLLALASLGLLIAVVLGSRTGLGRLLAPWTALGLALVAGLPLLPRAAWARSTPELAPARPTAPDAKEHRPGPNVVLVTLDTVRADHLSLHGYWRTTSPNLALLAQESTVYRHAIAPSTMTLATHASLFTGLSATAHGAHWDEHPHVAGRPLARELETLAEILREHGWRTVGIAANYGFFGPAFGLQQGFELFDAQPRTRPLDRLSPVLLAARLKGYLEHRLPLACREPRYRRGEEIGAQARELLGRLRDGGRPFFLFVNYMDAHDPYLPPEPWASMFLSPELDPLSDDAYLASLPDVETTQRLVDERARRLIVDRYDGAIAYVDAQVGALVDELRTLALLDDTLLIVTSDHGEAFGGGGLVGHGVSVYEDQVHVPLLVRYPGGCERGVVEEPVSLLDVLPTNLEELALEPPRSLEGCSLRAATEERMVVTESFPHQLSNSSRGVERAVYVGPWKLVLTASGAWELETRGAPGSSAAERGAVAQDLRDLLRRWVGWTDRRRARPAPQALPEDVLEALRTLGYAR